MRAILIDDEKPALAHLERLLRANGRIEPAALCTSAKEGIEYLSRERVDVVFLDIGMPEMNGLEAAEHIQQLDPRISIVFVTAYSDYAVEAFDLQAIDYLLKPIGASRLEKAIGRLSPGERRPAQPADRAEAEEAAAGGEPAREAEACAPGILAFRRLELRVRETGASKPVKWRTAKSQELFAYLLHRGEQWVTRDELIELLWPEASADKAVTHLHTSVYQIRKILKEWNAEVKLEYRQESYRLLRGGLETDAEIFEREADRLKSLDRFGAASAERLLALWTGGYLEQHDYPWAEARAEELKRRRLRLTLDLAAYETEAGLSSAANRRLSLLQQEEPFAEEVCRQQMLACERSGDLREALNCYRRLERRLDEELGVPPEKATRQLHERLRLSHLA
ncbi:response regulator [Saccharibacillus sp. CPCC 101409]|uniref:response regulator n=1 Tax=Saccharibacillus sp. CPCC 101409 TaxID=3058041 RepID=UPI0026734D45|nr:response regulator [Saccharibacillus sp. CPCC 101409]MDO3410032.1 response regulator [Saccharibacillus sp. CPCC 101409]